MKFKEYSEIENSYRQKYIDMIIQQGQNGGEDWVVTEKIHGSNFQFVCNGKEVQAGKRSCLLSDACNFFNWPVVYDKYKDAVMYIFNTLKIINPNLSQITIFGELHGGVYPHPDVPKTVNASQVQKGVYYCPHNDFIVFDIYKMEEGQDKGMWLSYTHVRDLCALSKMLVVQSLFKGKLEDALIYPNLFDSTIYTYYNLPKIENNTCEGVVIKPDVSRHFWSGERIIIKNKNDKFSENKSAKRDKVVQDKTMSEDTQAMYDKLADLVTENRLRNLLSKLGAVTDKDFGKLMSGMVSDIMTEFVKDNHDSYILLSKVDQTKISKKITGDVASLIRPNFLNIIDGTY